MASRLLAPLAVVAALLVAAPPAAGADTFRHDLAVVDGHLRIAIESAPEELFEALRSAELVCGLGEGAVAGGEPDQAAADWATLGQLVDQAAVGTAHRVDVAFRNADSALGQVRERYERRWSGALDRLRELRRGVRDTRRGIATMRVVIADLRLPFDSWKAHECEAARSGVALAFAPVGAALERINAGMSRLWRLSELPSPRTTTQGTSRA